MSYFNLRRGLQLCCHIKQGEGEGIGVGGVLLTFAALTKSLDLPCDYGIKLVLCDRLGFHIKDKARVQGCLKKVGVNYLLNNRGKSSSVQ